VSNAVSLLATLLTAAPQRSVVLVLLLGLFPFSALAEGARWNLQTSAGFDAYLNKYHLAVDDTTEALSEFNIAATIDGRSARRTNHQWHFRTEISGGSELFRELLDTSYRWRPDAGDPRLRLDLVGLGRQFQSGTSYTLSSDNVEGRADLRAYPWYGKHALLDLRLAARILDYETPSTLEQDYNQSKVGGFIRGRDTFERSWRLGAFVGQRTYPDSSAIDREFLILEGDYDQATEAADIRFYQRSERRLIEDETTRPSAWSHWTELELALASGPGKVVLQGYSEIWNYDEEYGAYFDSWRLEGEFGYRWGTLMDSTWQLLMALENLSAGDSPEAYSQASIRGSFESYAYPFTGVIALGYGQRWYSDQGTIDETDVSLDYSDFSFFEIWAMASWAINDHLSFDLIANYQPETHTEQTDDMALGFGSLRLVWRP